jgi:hypothetical protein
MAPWRLTDRRYFAAAIAAISISASTASVILFIGTIFSEISHGFGLQY